MAKRKTAKLISTGIAGLDEILRGGLPASNLYMLQGAPGAGKTTAALQFLRAGVEAGERGACGLFVLGEDVRDHTSGDAGHAVVGRADQIAVGHTGEMGVEGLSDGDGEVERLIV